MILLIIKPRILKLHKNGSRNVGSYYNQTQNHYQIWWNLNKSKALHSGIWLDDTTSFAELLQNTNLKMAELAMIEDGSTVLDAGCGVGGSSFFLAKMYNANVQGITISKKQLETAIENLQVLNLGHLVEFSFMDFCATTFKDHSFDIVWACETIVSAGSKAEILKESFRILKPGGRLVLADYILNSTNRPDPNQWIKQWKNSWALNNITTLESFLELIKTVGFGNPTCSDYTTQIFKSS